jgi:hypothetical protein
VPRDLQPAAGTERRGVQSVELAHSVKV